MKRHLMLSFVLMVLTVGFMASCATDGFDDESFSSDVKNTQLTSPVSDEITVTPNADGSRQTIAWPLVKGARGFEVKILNVNDPEQAVQVVDSIVDGYSVTIAREEDTNYELTIRTLGNTQLGNTDAAEATAKAFSTFSPTYATIKASEYTDLKEYFDAFPLPEDETGMLCIDLEGGANYTLSGDVNLGGHQVTIRSTSKKNHATLTIAQNAKFVTYASFYLKYLNIDCAQTNKPVVELSDTPAESLKNLENAKGDYYYISNPIVFQSCNFSNVGACLIQDQNKYVVRNLTFTDCVVAIDRTSAATNAVSSDPIVKLSKASYVTDFVVKNSTFYSKEHTTSAFLTYNGRPKDLGNDAELQKISFISTTLVNLSYNTNFRGDTRTQGQTSNYFTVEKCIIVDCGKKNFCNALLRQMSTNPTVSYNQNTYWWNGEDVSSAQTGDGADQTGTALTTDPAFVDAANGNFTPTGAEQVEKKTGDPRWFATAE